MKASGTLRFVASFYFCCLLTNRSAGQRVRQCASRPRRTWPRCCQARPPSRLAPSHTHARACPRPHSRMAHVCVKTAACATTQRLCISGITKSHITTTCVPWQAARFLEDYPTAMVMRCLSRHRAHRGLLHLLCQPDRHGVHPHHVCEMTERSARVRGNATTAYQRVAWRTTLKACGLASCSAPPLE